MYYFLTVLILIVSVLLILVVLVQNSKGGGLAANFASPNQVLGVRRTADFLEKSTWMLAVGVLLLSLAASMFMHSSEVGEDGESAIKNQVENAQLPDMSFED
ncbi:MAG: preprotein translocase subunit SecG [Bacteroidales bacterium]